MDSKEKELIVKRASRRRFLRGGAALAGLAAVGQVRPASGQALGAGMRRPGFVQDKDIPPENILKDPWTGEPLRDAEGNLIVDWTGSPQWKTYNQRLRALGGPTLGTREKDWRLYGYRSRFVTTVRHGHQSGPTTVKTPNISLLSPLEDQLGIITPTSLHFVDQHGLDPIDIDPRTWRFRVYGMVDRPFMVTLDEMMTRMPSVSRIHSVECNSDGSASFAERLAPWATAGHIYGEYSCSEWTGVLISSLLEAAGVQKGAKWLWIGSSDSTSDTVSIPLAKGLDDAMIVYGQNGEAIRPENGYPLRLLVPGFEGMRNIKRVVRIKVMDEPGLFMRETGGGYTDVRPDQKIRWFRYEHGVKSLIIQPSGGQQLHAKGYYEIRGLAWSGGGKIRRVEITTDGGQTWKDAQIQDPVFPKAATRWVFPWNWNGEELVIASRATDERGGTQPTATVWGKAWGVTVEQMRSAPPFPRMWRFNAIQPWKIDREGKVTNAILYAVL